MKRRIQGELINLDSVHSMSYLFSHYWIGRLVQLMKYSNPLLTVSPHLRTSCCKAIRIIIIIIIITIINPLPNKLTNNQTDISTIKRKWDENWKHWSGRIISFILSPFINNLVIFNFCNDIISRVPNINKLLFFDRFEWFCSNAIIIPFPGSVPDELTVV